MMACATRSKKKSDPYQAIYSIPTQEAKMPNSVYALQRLFYQLQTSETAVGTNELTKSFGWGVRQIFEAQDIVEFSRTFLELMEEKMKSTGMGSVLPQIFTGKVKTYISCINVDYETSRIEDFWDIQLGVRGNSNLFDSFKDYIRIEKLDGESQYPTGDQYGFQDAKKGVIFMSFPDVLQLELKRYEYDFHRNTTVKIYDRYEFPEVFDASPYLAEDADMSESWTYQLHGVLVHAGSMEAGHNYAFLKPNRDGRFYKYDDDRVTKATMREVLEGTFGGEDRTPNRPWAPMKKTTQMCQDSAYVLVYIRQCRLDRILTPVTAADIPAHLRTFSLATSKI
jgi:ubiquitin carboxyl-terminal hydrolase 7